MYSKIIFYLNFCSNQSFTSLLPLSQQLSHQGLNFYTIRLSFCLNYQSYSITFNPRNKSADRTEHIHICKTWIFVLLFFYLFIVFFWLCLILFFCSRCLFWCYCNNRCILWFFRTLNLFRRLLFC